MAPDEACLFALASARGGNVTAVRARVRATAGPRACTLRKPASQ